MEDDAAPKEFRLSLRPAALEDRRRIERALHDGAQQDLIAISVRLQLLRELVVSRPAAEVLESVDELQGDARSALERLRRLAGEIYPASLETHGLPAALRQAAAGSSVSARVETSDVGRYPAEIEAAVYFLWRTALDGGRPGAQARIALRGEDRALKVELHARPAAELSALRDLVRGAGGRLEVESERGDSHIVASFPVSRRGPAET
jgi:signal transduction histidine kinase